MPINITKTLHAGISVRNMDESVRWYAQNLGFIPVKDDGFLPPLGAHVCFLERDGFQIELFEYKEPKPLPEDRLLPNTDLQTIGTKHIAFQTDDMAAARAILVENGVEIVHEVTMDGESVMFIHDCNGVLIELIQPGK